MLAVCPCILPYLSALRYQLAPSSYRSQRDRLLRISRGAKVAANSVLGMPSCWQAKRCVSANLERAVRDSRYTVAHE